MINSEDIYRDAGMKAGKAMRERDSLRHTEALRHFRAMRDLEAKDDRSIAQAAYDAGYKAANPAPTLNYFR